MVSLYYVFVALSKQLAYTIPNSKEVISKDKRNYSIMIERLTVSFKALYGIMIVDMFSRKRAEMGNEKVKI